MTPDELLRRALAGPPSRNGRPRAPAADTYPGDHLHPIVSGPAPAFTPGDAYEGEPPRIVFADGRPANPPKERFRFIGSAEFASSDYRPQWLVPRVLVRGQPAVVAGPSKSLKTSLVIDLAVALAGGGRFLGAFDVHRPARVAVVSGESGQHTLQETAQRVCRASGITLADLDGRLSWSFDLPTFAEPGTMAAFAAEVATLNAEVVLIDPVYLCLGPIDAKNLFEMGAALRVVADVLLRAGATPVLVHHANRQLPIGEPMELTHLAYSGLEQFGRQFVLINRRERYLSDGSHDLWVRVGGSAGHGGLWAVRVDEGLTGDDFGGRTWAVTVQTTAEAAADRTAERDARKREDTRLKLVKDEADVLAAIDAVTAGGSEGATRREIRERTGHGDVKVKEVLGGLIDAGAVAEVVFQKATGNGTRKAVTGYRRADRE